MKFNLLALCGSLRTQSWSAALLRATRALAPPDVQINLFDRIGELPLFNPECEADAPAPVHELWNAVAAADAIIIASPEYAHGVTGTIKNALDWLVGCVAFAYKPVAVFNPSFQAQHADAALKETLRTMAATLIDAACVRIPVIGCGLELSAIAADPAFSIAIRSALAATIEHVNRAQDAARSEGDIAESDGLSGPQSGS